MGVEEGDEMCLGCSPEDRKLTPFFLAMGKVIADYQTRVGFMGRDGYCEDVVSGSLWGFCASFYNISACRVFNSNIIPSL